MVSLALLKHRADSRHDVKCKLGCFQFLVRARPFLRQRLQAGNTGANCARCIVQRLPVEPSQCALHLFDALRAKCLAVLVNTASKRAVHYLNLADKPIDACFIEHADDGIYFRRLLILGEKIFVCLGCLLDRHRSLGPRHPFGLQLDDRLPSRFIRQSQKACFCAQVCKRLAIFSRCLSTLRNPLPFLLSRLRHQVGVCLLTRSRLLSNLVAFFLCLGKVRFSAGQAGNGGRSRKGGLALGLHACRDRFHWGKQRFKRGSKT